MYLIKLLEEDSVAELSSIESSKGDSGRQIHLRNQSQRWSNRLIKNLLFNYLDRSGRVLYRPL